IQSMHEWKKEQLITDDFHHSVLQTVESQTGQTIEENKDEETTVEQQVTDDSLSFIKKKVISEMEETEEEVLEMDVNQFWQRVNDLYNNRHIPSNIYEYVQDVLMQQDQTQHVDEQEETPM